MLRHRLLLSTTLALGLAAAGVAHAQEEPERPGRPDRPERGERGERGERRFDPEQMRERMTEMMKRRLGVDDEEWEVLRPRIERVMQARQDARVGGGFGGGRRGMGGPGGGPGGDGDGDDGGDRPGRRGSETALGKAAAELRQTLADDAASAEQVKGRLDAFRAARDEAEAELTQAQASLKEVLTQRQEATLVMTGVLE